MNQKSLCKLCGERSDFVKAHILPRSFYPNRARGRPPLHIVSPEKGERPRRAPVGIYDQNLVCGHCENGFNAYDDYAAKLLVEMKGSWRERRDQNKLLAYQVNDYDYKKLKLFILSTLWRAAASERQEFMEVKLGPFMPRLHDLLHRAEPGDPEEFGTIIRRFGDIESGTSAVFSPAPERFDGIRFYNFIAGSYVFYVKVDKRKTNEPYRSLIMRPSAPLTIIAKEFRGGREERYMKKILAGLVGPVAG